MMRRRRCRRRVAGGGAKRHPRWEVPPSPRTPEGCRTSRITGAEPEAAGLRLGRWAGHASAVRPTRRSAASSAAGPEKGLNEAIGELHSQLVDSAWQRVIHKEDRDIVEETDLSYTECSRRLEEARLAFRSLNRRLRAASFEVSVEFEDE